jgi:hypothetical protein
MVDGPGHVGQQLRVAVGVAGHQRADLDARRLLGPGRQNSPAFEMRSVGITVKGKEVIPGECDIDTEVLAAANGVADVVVTGRVLRLQLHTDSNRAIRVH